MENIWESLVNVNLFLQSIGDWIFFPMHWITFLGDEEFYLLVMPAIYWCVDSRFGIRMGMILMLSNSFGTSLKFLFHSPRPFWVSPEITAYVQETSFGMPSGHALNAMALWGYVAFYLKKLWVKIGFFALIFLIGLSRMVLGVHMINDVLVGWIAGGLLLLIFMVVEKKYEVEIQGWNFRKKILWILGSTIILLGFPVLIWAINHGVQINEAWVINYAKAYPGVELSPYSLAGAVTAAATWMGLLLGLLIIEKLKLTVSVSGPFLQRVFRYVIGVIGVLVFWMGLKMIFPDGDTLIALIFRFFRYTLIGLWVSFGAPFVFKKLNIMKSS